MKKWLVALSKLVPPDADPFDRRAGLDDEEHEARGRVFVGAAIISLALVSITWFLH